jgi:hypothetical protein
MGNSLFNILSEKYPFITMCVYGGDEYVGVIQNRDDFITTIYDFGDIVEPELKKQYLALASEWWEESNRQIPINIFLKEDWAIFKPFLRTFVNKDLKILWGPCTSLSELSKKKTKRRSITLVTRMR